VDQTQAVLAAQFGQSLAAGDGGGDAALEEGVVDRFVGVEGPEAGADLRRRAVRGAAERAQVVGQHLDGVARTRPAFEPADRAGEQPGVALHRRAFLARHQDQLGHAFPDLKCNKPRLPRGNRGMQKHVAA